MNKIAEYVCYGGIALNLPLLWVGFMTDTINLQYLSLLNLFMFSIGLLLNNK